MTTSALDERTLAAREWLQSAEGAQLTVETRANIDRWLSHAAYADALPALLDLLESRDVAQLTALFWEQLPFGTGGRRGPMADFGSASINRYTIAESARGLADYVLSQRHESALPPHAAIAFDTRKRSDEFARVTAQVLAAAGLQVWLYATPHATPQLSFAVRHLGCDCGVMISASHNPPADNGFKAYWSHGGQVLPPHDQGIIAAVSNTQEIPTVDFDCARESGQIRDIDAAVDAEYVRRVVSLSRNTQRRLKILYTPLHGVGETSIVPVLSQAGFGEVEIFEPQRTQDGNFPNVPDHLPNPERAAVFRGAIDYAEQQGHDLILASDPDADRLAAAVRTADGYYACLSGNQLGALLTEYGVTRRPQALAEGYVLTTLVTTPLIATICRTANVRVTADLPVGFKHIGAAMEREGAERLIFAAEESLGYLAGDYCRDKDAAIAALWCAELAAELKSNGQTLLDQLTALQHRYGWHRESQISRTLSGPTGAVRMARIIHRFREQPPAQVGEATVQRFRDYGRQVIRSAPQFQVSGQLAVAAGDLLFADVVYAGVTGQVGLRPSGTEPKIKCYFFAQAPATMPYHEGEQRTMSLMKELESGLMQWMDAVP